MMSSINSVTKFEKITVPLLFVTKKSDTALFKGHGLVFKIMYLRFRYLFKFNRNNVIHLVI